jgi:hypothetical protein
MLAELGQQHLGEEHMVQDLLLVPRPEPVGLMTHELHTVAVDQRKQRNDLAWSRLELLPKNALEVIGARHGPLPALFAAE